MATHLEDDLVLSLAVDAAAEYLVTGDRGLLSVERTYGVEIVTPLQFLGILNAKWEPGYRPDEDSDAVAL